MCSLFNQGHWYRISLFSRTFECSCSCHAEDSAEFMVFNIVSWPIFSSPRNSYEINHFFFLALLKYFCLLWKKRNTTFVSFYGNFGIVFHKILTATKQFKTCKLFCSMTNRNFIAEIKIAFSPEIKIDKNQIKVEQLMKFQTYMVRVTEHKLPTLLLRSIQFLNGIRRADGRKKRSGKQRKIR